MKTTGKVPLALTAGVLVLGLTTAVSAAVYTDQANLNLGNEGIGFPYKFDIGLVLPDDTVTQAELPDGVDWVVKRAADLLPGHEVSTEIPVFNNTPTLIADTKFEVVLRNDDGSVAKDVPNITPYLRFTASVGGTTVFEDVTWDQAHGAIGALSARESDALSAGDAFVPGANGSRQTLELTIKYLDEPGVEALNGGQAALAVRFDAESAKP